MISARDKLITEENAFEVWHCRINLTVNRFLNYTELVTLDYDEVMNYHIIGHFQLQTGASIKMWN